MMRITGCRFRKYDSIIVVTIPGISSLHHIC
jgi:hypothetical protein